MARELTGKAFYDVVKGMPATATRAVLAAQRRQSGVLRVGFTASAALQQCGAAQSMLSSEAYLTFVLLVEEGNTIAG